MTRSPDHPIVFEDHMKQVHAFLLALLIAAPVAAQTPAAAADPAGTWDATFTTGQGEIPAQLKLRKDGDKLIGTIASQMGEAPLEWQAKDKTLTIWFTFAAQNGPTAIEMVGTVDGEIVKGSFCAGGQSAGEWIATKAKDASAPAAEKKEAPATTSPAAKPAASLTGDWVASVQLENINATPGLSLKQDGEKLTGEYTSAQYGKFPLNGTAKGDDVSIWFAMSVEGTAINVTYTGKIQPDGSIQGSVNFGDMMSGTFSATKKK
jgi:hypothetical protein